MQHVVIAVDVDGTLYDGVGVAAEAVDAVREAHDNGHTLVIVTGRRWEELGHVVPGILGFVARVVCEEGGVLVNVESGKLTLLAEGVEADLVAALRAAEVPYLDVGHVVVGAPTTSEALVAKVRDTVGSTRRIVTNKGSIALAPVGCDKASGLRAAIADLQLEELPIVAIGDASNDLPMFAIATFAFGVANADDAVRASGVQLTTASFGSGVAEALRDVLQRSEMD